MTLKGHKASPQAIEANRLSHLGHKASEETKLKMSLARKGKKMPPRSEEHKQKMRLAMSGRKLSEEHKRKIGIHSKGANNPMFGKTHSPEARLKISEARAKYTGVNHPFYGKHHKPETIVKMSKERSHNWKGDNVSYRNLHIYIRKYFPKPEECQQCGMVTSKLDLANITGIYNRDFSNWKYLCRLCHEIYDGNIRNLKQYQNK